MWANYLTARRSHDLLIPSLILMAADFLLHRPAPHLLPTSSFSVSPLNIQILHHDGSTFSSEIHPVNFASHEDGETGGNTGRPYNHPDPASN